ncbi:thiamine-phosphate synthase family protein [Halococcoides cellulosivorans]|uniref:DNA-binding protein n=1 Tax=Halococcoides cellulosivorans TaxID=1679096 RepID=A0A2R4X207_9EURY|nr:thiamine-phosphate synthase family protein [Halococcoides cellulosivorans]AWB27763.1 DNA-binding protein [Halococcoides cellulosivorans]
MKFVEEVVVESVLPTVRSLLAEALADRGRTQREVADLLGISQSAVSKYVHGEIDRNERVQSDDRVVALVEELADGLANGEISQVQALVELEVLIRQLERGDLIAELHTEAMPALADADADFTDVHDPESRLRQTERVRGSVRRGLSRLEHTAGFGAAVPQVGSNLVECLPAAADLADVCGVPGRIFEVGGRAVVPDDPEFGVSEHVASILLAARSAGHPARAALNVRYEPALLDRLDSTGATAVAFDPEADRDAAIAAALADDPDADVLYQTGAFGIEPILYVLGADASAVADRVASFV